MASTSNAFPDEHAVELVEKQIAQQWKKRLDDEE